MNKLGKKIIRERQSNGLFTDCQDFFDRMSDNNSKPGKNALESLIYSGAMDSFGLRRSQMIAIIPILENNYKKDMPNRQLEQISMFSTAETRVPIPNVQEFADKHLMAKERETIGFYLTKHPVDELYTADTQSGCVPITDLLTNDLGGEEVRTSVYAIIKDIRQIFTKRDEEMYLFTAEDRFNELKCVMFPKRVPANKHRLTDGALVKLVGYYSVDEQRGPQLNVQDILLADEFQERANSVVVVTIQNKTQQDLLVQFVKDNPGKTMVKLSAKGKQYSLSGQLNLTPAALSFLKENFPRVSS